MFNTLEYQL